MQDLLDHSDWQEPLKSRAARKIARASQGHFVVSLTYGDEVDGCGQVITFESLLEYRTAICLLYRPDLGSLREQVGPFLWRAPWNTSEKPNKHWLDLLYTDKYGYRTAFVIKNFRAARRERFREGLEALCSYLVPHHADQLCLVTERSICRIELFNAEMMHGLRHADPEADEELAARTANMTQPSTISEFMEASTLTGRVFPAVVRALRSQSQRWDRTTKITPTTLVWPAILGDQP